VIQVGDAVSQFEGVVKWQQVAQRTETDTFGPQQGLGDQQVGRRTGFPGSSEVFADPGLLETERVKPFNILKIPTLAVPYRSLGRVRGH
jgi:hypothetical protein